MKAETPSPYMWVWLYAHFQASPRFLPYTHGVIIAHYFPEGQGSAKNGEFLYVVFGRIGLGATIPDIALSDMTDALLFVIYHLRNWDH